MKTIDATKASWQNLLKRKKSLKRSLREARGAGGFSEETLANEYHKVVSEAGTRKEELAAAKYGLLRFLAPVMGERDLFDEYVFRAGHGHDSSSWQILAEMRHHGVPTRLLDWTERFDIALFFALTEVRAVAQRENPKTESDLADLVERLSGRGYRPCIWVLNPYLLAYRVTSRRSIWDFTRDPSNDYYRSVLIERDWAFDGPVPIFPPWRIPRVDSQRGFFTVHGNRKEPVEQQLPSVERSLEKIVIPLEAAVYGVYYLSRVFALDDFSVFQDLDSLGRTLSGKFQRMHAKPEAMRESSLRRYL